mgnify:CR=1 FL=1
MIETRIKEIGEYATTYTILRAETKEELFDKIYVYFKSNQYCWQVSRRMEDTALAKEYNEWELKNFNSLWFKHATGRDFD